MSTTVVINEVPKFNLSVQQGDGPAVTLSQPDAPALTLSMSGPQGPTGATGAAGPNSVTSSTTSDGTGTLSLSSLSLSTPLPLASGGTGGTTAGTARTNLGLGTADTPTFSNLTLNTGTITVPQPLAFSQTWNASAMTFSAFQMNVTDTASASGSMLMDLRVGGVSKMEVSKSGNLRVKSTSADGGSLGHAIGFDIGALTWGFSNGGANSFRFGILNDAHLYVTSAKQWRFAGTTNIGWAPTTPDGAADLLLARDGAAGTLAQRNGGNLQQFRLYATYTSATDYHRLTIATARSTHTGMTGATITVASIIPAGAVVVGVTCKVTTAITGATSFDLGTVADPDRFGAGIGVAAGTTSDNRNWTAGTIECFPTTTSLLITANGGNFTDGAVYVSVQYLSGQAD